MAVRLTERAIFDGIGCELESGVKMPALNSWPQGGGQGRELNERALPYQLNADTSFEMEPDGVLCTITIPVSATTISEDANG
jgi:two-component system CheB/CheR fusion protein